jgi:hypothetical protein
MTLLHEASKYGVSIVVAGEGPGLADRQKRLADMWEELQNMRQNKQ